MNRTDLIHWYCLLRAQNSQFALADPTSVLDKARQWVDKLIEAEPDGLAAILNPHGPLWTSDIKFDQGSDPGVQINMSNEVSATGSFQATAPKPKKGKKERRGSESNAFSSGMDSRRNRD